MEPMEYNAISQLEKELVFVLKEEYSFYQSLYVMLDKQRDLIRYNKDEKLLDLFSEIERIRLRIQKSEEKIASLKNKNPRLFKLASIAPDVRKIINGIITIIKKSINLVNENEDYTKNRYERIQVELGELKNSQKILQYLQKENTTPQFIDGKK